MLRSPLGGLRRAAGVATIAALALSARGAARAVQVAAPAAAPAAWAERTLANGLRVVVVEDRAAPVVETSMWYRFGAGDEAPGRTGLAHALERMMYAGTPSLSASGFDDVAARTGALVDATTANDYTRYDTVLPAEKLDLALRIEADRMTHLSFDEAAWRRERAAALEASDADLGQPLTRLYDKVCRAAAPQRVCSLSALGDREDVARASAADVRASYDRWYAPGGAVLVITGDVGRSEGFAAAERAFGAIPSRATPAREEARPAYASDAQVEIQGDFPYEVVDLAYAAPGTRDPDAGAAALVDGMINDRDSDFYRALVTSGYTLGYSTQLDQNALGGIYHVFLVVAPGHTSKQARDAFAGVLETGERGGFPQAVLDAARASARRRALFALDSLTGLGARAGYALAIERADPGADEARVLAATPDDVRIAVRRYFETPAVTGLLTPVRQRAGEPPRMPTTVVADDFGKRVPTGPVVEAGWVRRALAVPIAARSAIRPTGFVLPDGLRVLVQRRQANPSVTIAGTVETSQRFDPPGKEGLGAMVSALLGYGSGAYDAATQRATVAGLGAELDLGYSFDARGRASDLGTLASIVAAALSAPAFPESAIAAVRAETLAAIAERDADPDYRASRDFERLLLHGDDPTLREPDAASIGRITRADLVDYARAYVRPDLTTVAVVGDVTPDDVKRAFFPTFAPWRAAGPKPDVGSEGAPYPRAARRYVIADRRTVVAHLGEPAPALGAKDYPALNVLNTILGAGGAWDARLPADLASRRGLAYAVASSLTVDKYRGTLDFRLTADPRNLAAAVASLRRELDLTHVIEPSDAEVARAKDKIVAGALVSQQSARQVAARVLTIGLIGLPLDYDATIAARYAKVTPAEVRESARLYVHPNQLIEVFEGPQP